MHVSNRSVPEIFSTLRATSKFQSQFDITANLGAGRYGMVYQVARKGFPKPAFAIKSISVTFESLKDDLDDIRMALNESNILKVLNGNNGHKNIVKMYDYWVELENGSSREHCDGPFKFYIQMEFCSRSLNDWKIQNCEQRYVPETSQVINMATQIFDALAYIHDRSILHLDINVRYVLLLTESIRYI